ncbi:MAG: hypothetical protein LBG29_03900 [Synergistaceae bacterium]|jgi:citrate lyase synthetase|nr:hypothetical protein [Synergistaceae bacterium]
MLYNIATTIKIAREADMYGYRSVTISQSDRHASAQADRLLAQEGIKRDSCVDYMVGIYDESDELVATGATYGNTIRCVAVDSARQGEGLLGTVVSRLWNASRASASPMFFCTRNRTRRGTSATWGFMR